MTNTSYPYLKRRIRSFVCRNSRLTRAQREAIEILWPYWGLNKSTEPVDLLAIFKNNAPINLEIGFGSGQSLFALARAYPEQNFVGIETHQPGVGALLLAMQAQQVENIRIYNHDAVEILTHCIPDKSIDRIQIFFPDPWQKRRHHKRRLIQANFIALLVKKLKPRGEIHLATDWEDYALEMLHVLTASPDLINCADSKRFSDRSPQRPVVTKFEEQARRAGRRVWELQFISLH